MRELAGHQAYFAWGFGGQYIILVPDLDLVVVTTSASTVAKDRRTHRRTLFELVEDLVIAPVAQWRPNNTRCSSSSASAPGRRRGRRQRRRRLIDAKNPSDRCAGRRDPRLHFVRLRRSTGRRVVTAALGDATAMKRPSARPSSMRGGRRRVRESGIRRHHRPVRASNGSSLLAVQGVKASALSHAARWRSPTPTPAAPRQWIPDTLVDAAARTGATGVLLDKALTSTGPAFDISFARDTRSVGRRAHEAGLMVAVAGKLTAGDLPFLFETGADIAGVRGAACENGRSSRVTVEKVRVLCHAQYRGRPVLDARAMD